MKFASKKAVLCTGLIFQETSQETFFRRNSEEILTEVALQSFPTSNTKFVKYFGKSAVGPKFAKF